MNVEQQKAQMGKGEDKNGDQNLQVCVLLKVSSYI